ncbi:glutamate-5-semialdehyde dehydrogenase [Pectinatus cerevisiiphilus]|uniref:Gamma-glutamyl phosphate reductase n=1 Tax=Pectinatus cerevisiiphilus TaxID=86956 RepID=A0A4R3K7H6_9FIRM|nr:glutamate-5-semialdehyde dehydrogenase [Pectinatus cerevisiiphilus]TCS78748.1 glutamate-5-semialdehyde dehydrogenase [Pectinatus cerevisiiphilus]
MEKTLSLNDQAKAARLAANELIGLSTLEKNKALQEMADALEHRQKLILSENKIDLANGRNKNLSSAMLDRLMLNEERIHQITNGLRQIAALPDPIGSGLMEMKRPNGLDIRAVRVPLGVIGIIYEARPNVTADVAGLCIKSGNAVLLRGGSEAINTNKIISSILATAASSAGMPEGAIQFIESTDRGAITELLHLRKYIDVIIPRGGSSLIKYVVENSTVPVIETGAGICHAFVDKSADKEMAADIIVNAKTSRPAVCNTIETLLVHQDIAKDFIPFIVAKLAACNVELRGCERTRAIYPDMAEATEDDWSTEYHDLILSIKVVDDINAAIKHINTYGTKHSEVIITNEYTSAQLFQQKIDASAVYVNASTRFTDGFEFGFGAEIGISTQKLHARGPMGLNALTTMKYLINGNGQVR